MEASRKPSSQAFRLTAHARMQMERRGIQEEEVARVLAAPEQAIHVRGARWVYQSRFVRGEPPSLFLLRVVVELGAELPLVITAYWTSKVAKYTGEVR